VEQFKIWFEARATVMEWVGIVLACMVVGGMIVMGVVLWKSCKSARNR
jgi:hypothetical protein